MKTRKRQTAFDAVPSDRKYRLRLARYVGLAEAIASYIKQKDSQRLLRLREAGLRAAVVGLLDRWFGIKRPHVQSFTCPSFKRMVLSAGPLQIKACRGFRITSGGLLTRLEDYGWWYRLNRRVGKAVPWLCTEVQLVLIRTEGVPASFAYSAPAKS